MNHTKYNQDAWDAIATSKRKWFEPVSTDQITEARAGRLKIKVTATKDLPDDWLSTVGGAKVLCLAAGGGHQGPLLAAAGAIVTVADFSDAQLEIDRKVARQESLSIETLQCDMQDLGDIGLYDIVLNPCSVNFCADVRKVWGEAWRVLRPGGVFITGFICPVNYLFDASQLLRGRFQVCSHSPVDRPAIDEDDPTVDVASPIPIEFAHSFFDLIGGQIEAGFRICDFFEDRWGGDDLLSDRIAVFAATRAVKLEL